MPKLDLAGPYASNAMESCITIIMVPVALKLECNKFLTVLPCLWREGEELSKDTGGPSAEVQQRGSLFTPLPFRFLH